MFMWEGIVSLTLIFQGQLGGGFEQPDLEDGVPAHVRGVGTK